MMGRVLGALWLALPLAAASIEGSVTDGAGHAVTAASVRLKSGAEPGLTTQTDSEGKYRFAELSRGTYTITVETAAGAAQLGPFVLRQEEIRHADLALRPAEFFDEPNFVVAGVTDTTSHGGHGPDTAVRSAESLAKAAAALGPPPVSDNNPLEAVREYQRAAERNPSEPNLFHWGAELILHGAAEPATQVFAKGNRFYPSSTRMLLGLAVSWYARASYDLASRYFFEACDLNPADPIPYSFLSQAQTTEITLSPGYLDRMARFARLHPENAAANYDYAAALWKQHKEPAKVESLLTKALQIEPNFWQAYLQLGIYYQDQREYTAAMTALEKASGINAENPETHYRLAQLYRRSGNSVKADRELQLSQELERKTAEKERGAMQRFVWTLRDVP